MPSASLDACAARLQVTISTAWKPQASPSPTIPVRRYTSEVLVSHIHLAPKRHKILHSYTWRSYVLPSARIREQPEGTARACPPYRPARVPLRCCSVSLLRRGDRACGRGAKCER